MSSFFRYLLTIFFDLFSPFIFFMLIDVAGRRTYAYSVNGMQLCRMIFFVALRMDVADRVHLALIYDKEQRAHSTRCLASFVLFRRADHTTAFLKRVCRTFSGSSCGSVVTRIESKKRDSVSVCHANFFACSSLFLISDQIGSKSQWCKFGFDCWAFEERPLEDSSVD